MNQFIGRRYELEELRDVQKFGRSCLVVVRGRRRIGKSRLVKEFAKGNRLLYFSGKAPTEMTTKQGELDLFAESFAEQLSIPKPDFPNWYTALRSVSKALTQEQTVIVFDEISWMGSKDDGFVGDLKLWWDGPLEEYCNLTLIFCGSVSTWIEKNIIASTAFFGRITLKINLKQLSLPESTKLLSVSGVNPSSYDIFKILAVTGGVPWYLEQIKPHIPVDDNIKRLCFREGGLLTKEFNYIFHDLFPDFAKATTGTNGHSSEYRKIIEVLAGGMKDLQGIAEALGTSHQEKLEPAMEDLVIAGFVTEHYSWSFKTGAEKKTHDSLFRLSDNYLRFHVKYIEPAMKKIALNEYEDAPLESLSNWDAVMGLQVENLLLNNRSLLIKSLGINPSSIVGSNPYQQRARDGLRGCQIDYLVQTKSQTLYACEFKFKRQEIGLEIIESMQEKISRLSLPEGFKALPVLFYFGGVKDSVHAKRYFYRIINVQDFLQE